MTILLLLLFTITVQTSLSEGCAQEKKNHIQYKAIQLHLKESVELLFPVSSGSWFHAGIVLTKWMLARIFPKLFLTVLELPFIYVVELDAPLDHSLHWNAVCICICICACACDIDILILESFTASVQTPKGWCHE